MRKPTVTKEEGKLDYHCEVSEPEWTEADAACAFMFSALSSLGKYSLDWFMRHSTEPFQTIAEMADFLEAKQREHPTAPSSKNHPAYHYRSFNVMRIGEKIRVSYRSYSLGNPHTDTVLENTQPLRLAISGERKSSVVRRANAAIRQQAPPSLLRKVGKAT